MRRRAVVVGLSLTALAAGLLGSAGVANAAQSAKSRIVLAPGHHLSAKPGAGGHGGGGGGTPWPGWASSNWSGYAVTHTTYTAATGHWTVPTPARTRGSTYSAAWVGIGGFNDAALIQTGTEQDFVNGRAVYAAWWTTDAQGYAETSFPQGVNVHAGDTMDASIVESTSGSWTITLTDASTGQTGTETLDAGTYTNPGLSAEWIMEAPGIGGHQSTIANFGSDVFDSGTVNGNRGPGFTDADAGELIQKNVVVTIPSKPDKDTDGFTIKYGSSQPAPPSS